MTLYVDNMRRRAQIKGRPANWSHLMADTSEELHAAARALGLKPEWIQHKGTHREHFDVTDMNRKRAIRFLGAVELKYPHETGALLARKRQEATDG